MARIDIQTFDGPLLNGVAFVEAELLFEMGLRAAAGSNGVANLVEAHVFFNLAAAKGWEEAPFHRQDVASQMTKAEIAAALRAARAALARH